MTGPSTGGDEGGRTPVLEDGGERLLAAVLDSLDDAVLVVGPPRRGIVRVCNDAVTRMFGYPPDELAGGTTERLHVDRAAFERFGELSRVALEATGRFEADWTMRRRDGSRFEAEITVSVLDPARGWQGGVVSVVRDVSQRVRAERERAEALRRHEALFSNALDAILVADDDGRYVDANPSACRLLGYRRDELVGLPLDAVVAQGEDWRDAWSTLRERGVFRGEIALRDRDGGEIPAEHHAVADVLPGVHASFSRDLRERRAAERALRTSEARFRRAFDEAPIGAVLLSPDLVIRHANDVFVSLSGRSRQELVGTCAIELTVPEDVDPEVPGRILRERAVRGLERRYRRPDGSLFWGRVSAGAILDAEGRPAEILAMVENITPLVEAAEERERLLAEVRALAHLLSETEQAERRAVARELHDAVGQNMAALSLNLAVIRRDLAGRTAPRIAALLDDSLETLQHVGARIRDVMAELRPPMLDDFGVVATLRWLAERFRTRTGITAAMRGREPDPRLGDPAEMTLVRVAQEALANVARHASPRRVTITLHCRDDLVRLTVTDDGVGFDPRERPRANDGGGWGIVGMRERMEAIGGSVRVDSAPGRGTRVVAEVPR